MEQRHYASPTRCHAHRINSKTISSRWKAGTEKFYFTFFYLFLHNESSSVRLHFVSILYLSVFFDTDTHYIPMYFLFTQIILEFEIVVDEDLGLQFEFILAPQSPVFLGFRDRPRRL